MVFNSGALPVILVVGSAAWLMVLTIVVVRMMRHYNRLTQGTAKASLGEILETILARQERQAHDAAVLQKELTAVGADGLFHVQRVGLVRFNPFADTGGAQSFTLALLDGYNTGIVMTSLYGRTGNRWYVKEVRGGKGVAIALSKEEESAIKKAISSQRNV